MGLQAGFECTRFDIAQTSQRTEPLAESGEPSTVSVSRKALLAALSRQKYSAFQRAAFGGGRSDIAIVELYGRSFAAMLLIAIAIGGEVVPTNKSTAAQY